MLELARPLWQLYYFVRGKLIFIFVLIMLYISTQSNGTWYDTITLHFWKLQMTFWKQNRSLCIKIAIAAIRVNSFLQLNPYLFWSS